MKFRFFVAILVLILVAPLIAQDEGIQEGVIHKQFQDDNPPVSIQVAKGDKTGSTPSIKPAHTGISGETNQNFFQKKAYTK